jgi:hypothetical protein
MRLLALAVVAGAAGCSFEAGTPLGDKTDAPPQQPIDAPRAGSDALVVVDGPATPIDAAIDATIVPPDASHCWSWTTSNFDSCTILAASGALAVHADQTINTDSPPSGITHQTITQSDGSHALLLHVTSLQIDAGKTVTVTGTLPLIVAADGSATIAGTVTTTAGADDPTGCAGRTGSPGNASTVADTGGGGAGGGGAEDDGGNGTAGTQGNSQNGQGAGGAHGSKHDDANLVPLIAGCAGGPGGISFGASGAAGTAGPGGGAVQISAQTSIAVSGSIRALGGSGGATTQQTGGGGGGTGGAIFLEALAVGLTSSARLCADGGAGSQGGGSTSPGTAANTSPCSGTSGAAATSTNDFGGAGGTGGFLKGAKGGDAGGASNASMGGHGAGGGGGGGAAGYIRLHQQAGNATATTGSIVTPAATN